MPRIFPIAVTALPLLASPLLAVTNISGPCPDGRDRQARDPASGGFIMERKALHTIPGGPPSIDHAESDNEPEHGPALA